MKHKVSLNIAVSQLEEVLIAQNMLSEQHYIDSLSNITYGRLPDEFLWL